MSRDYKLLVVTSDHQIPFHDLHLHELTYEWLRQNKPDSLYILGDFLDFPSLSRFSRDPYSPECTIKDCIDGGKIVLNALRKAAGVQCTDRRIFEGNHEKRLGLRLFNSNSNLQELGEYVSVDGLLGCKDGGWLWMGGYPNTQLQIAPQLAVRHGWIVRKGSGASALATLQHLKHSVIIGHTHRACQIFYSQVEIDGSVSVHQGIENGTMCDPKKQIYAQAPDWQQGFSVVRLFKNGLFSISQAIYVNSQLIWEDKILS